MYQGEIDPVSLLSLIRQRQSDRNYEAKPIEPEKMERVMEAARLAPSACNAQPWKFVVIDDLELKNRVADATSSRIVPINHFTKQAPVIIAVVEERANITSRVGTAVKGTEFPPIDIGISVGQLCLQAAVEGLGTCIVGWFDHKKVKELLKIPKNRRVPLLVVIGYPVGKTRDKVRKDIDQIVSKNRY